MGECGHASTTACANRSEDDLGASPHLPPYLRQGPPIPHGVASVHQDSWHFNFWVFTYLSAPPIMLQVTVDSCVTANFYMCSEDLNSCRHAWVGRAFDY